MKITENVTKAKTNPEIVIGVDPGSKYTGLVAVDRFGIVKSITAKTDKDAYNFFDEVFKDTYCSVVAVFERPFSATNLGTFSDTNITIGFIKGLLWFMCSDAEFIHVTPTEGNTAIGLKNASTHDIAKMNMAKANKWDLITAHEVSAYAAVLAAEKRGAFEWSIGS